MLRIYDDALWMVREVYAVAKVVERHDGDLARQMRRSSSSVVLNLSEGCYSRKGSRIARWSDAMGSANETRSALQLADLATSHHTNGGLRTPPRAQRSRPRPCPRHGQHRDSLKGQLSEARTRAASARPRGRPSTTTSSTPET